MIALIVGLPHDVSVGEALHVAGAAGRLNAIDFRFDWTQTYTFWSGLLGGLFLMLSYFGCDQSQVQRYLTAKSVDEARHSLLMSAFVKIPLQALVLLTGVLVFVFYLFNQPPMLFNRVHAETGRAERARGRVPARSRRSSRRPSQRAARRRGARARRRATRRRGARALPRAPTREMKAIRGRAAHAGARRHRRRRATSDVTGDTPAPDVNYVFPTFVTTQAADGLVGLIIAAIFAAAMSSIAGGAQLARDRPR